MVDVVHLYSPGDDRHNIVSIPPVIVRLAAEAEGSDAFQTHLVELLDSASDGKFGFYIDGAVPGMHDARFIMNNLLPLADEVTASILAYSCAVLKLDAEDGKIHILPFTSYSMGIGLTANGDERFFCRDLRFEQGAQFKYLESPGYLLLLPRGRHRPSLGGSSLKLNGMVFRLFSLLMGLNVVTRMVINSTVRRAMPTFTLNDNKAAASAKDTESEESIAGIIGRLYSQVVDIDKEGGDIAAVDELFNAAEGVRGLKGKDGRPLSEDDQVSVFEAVMGLKSWGVSPQVAMERFQSLYKTTAQETPGGSLVIKGPPGKILRREPDQPEATSNPEALQNILLKRIAAYMGGDPDVYDSHRSLLRTKAQEGRAAQRQSGRNASTRHILSEVLRLLLYATVVRSEDNLFLDPGTDDRVSVSIEDKPHLATLEDINSASEGAIKLPDDLIFTFKCRRLGMSEELIESILERHRGESTSAKRERETSALSPARDAEAVQREAKRARPTPLVDNLNVGQSHIEEEIGKGMAAVTDVPLNGSDKGDLNRDGLIEM